MFILVEDNVILLWKNCHLAMCHQFYVLFSNSTGNIELFIYSFSSLLLDKMTITLKQLQK